MLISEQYRKLNEELHLRSDVKYGARGHRHATEVTEFAAEIGAKSVLDYGCGKGTLRQHIKLPCHPYDPAVPRFAAEPPAADLVVCTDVLEHIEPEHLDSVLDHIASKAMRGVFLVIATRLDGTKLLSDGSNPHKIVKRGYWWRKRLKERFDVVRESEVQDKEYRVWLTAKGI